VPNRPAANLLRAQTKTQYDNQGRVFESNVFSVDQGNGSVSANSVKTDCWYNHRGLVIKIAIPGGLVTKTAYDGAGRTTVVSCGRVPMAVRGPLSPKACCLGINALAGC
jgi:YD repeat-containing protein